MNQIKTEDFQRFENGEMNSAEEIEFMQKLIDTGMVWTLQGWYGRKAQEMIDQGLCQLPSGKETKP